jgi:dihydrofolate synthase/folylpolyglutamate synthase
MARAGGTIAEALAMLPHAPPGRVLICGSLYLAGEVLGASPETRPV